MSYLQEGSIQADRGGLLQKCDNIRSLWNEFRIGADDQLDGQLVGLGVALAVLAMLATLVVVVMVMPVVLVVMPVVLMVSVIVLGAMLAVIVGCSIGLQQWMQTAEQCGNSSMSTE